LKTSASDNEADSPTFDKMTWPFIVSPVLGILFLIIIFVPVVVKRRRHRVRYSVLQEQEADEHPRGYSTVNNQDYDDIDSMQAEVLQEDVQELDAQSKEGTSRNILSSSP
jgi:hypothetical protein